MLEKKDNHCCLVTWISVSLFSDDDFIYFNYYIFHVLYELEKIRYLRETSWYLKLPSNANEATLNQSVGTGNLLVFCTTGGLIKRNN